MFFTGKKNWVFSTFVLSKIFYSLGLLALAFRFTIPEFISQNIGGILLFLGISLEVFCFISSDNQFRKRELKALAIPFAIFFMFNLIPQQTPDYVKGIFSAVLGTYTLGFGGIVLLLAKNNSKFRAVFGFIFLLFALGWAIHGIHLFYLQEEFRFMVNEYFTLNIIFVLGEMDIIVGSFGFLLILKEVDELKIAKDKLELKKLIHQKNKFFSIIAHDLRGPIGTLTQLGQNLLKKHEKISPKFREEIISSIYLSAQKTFTLLDNLLQWARSESGTIEIKPVLFQLRDLIEQSVDLFKDKIEEKNLEVKIDMEYNLKCFADYKMMSVVFNNLISNAIKYTPDGGFIGISGVDQDSQIQIAIKDSGIGIDTKVQQTIFEIDSDYLMKGTNNEGGSGLGLKLCKGFVTKNSGKISLESELNNGSIFYVSLPKKQEKKTLIDA